MNLIDELTWRGLIHQVTDQDVARKALDGGAAVYIGFDPTAESLHVGSLLQVMLLKHAQRCGNPPIALVGGGTGMIGDPSGKSAERNLLDDATLDRNAAGMRAQLERFLDFDGAVAARMVNNLDWLGGLSLIAFLRDVGKHFSVNAMVQRDSVRNRLESRESGISYTEFSYMLLQAYDFLALWREQGCAGQLGGSDQWGNIVSGIDLIRRHQARTGEQGAGPAFGVTSPLITKRDGSKFGKSEAGNVWLDPERTSPFRFYQFWLNAEDDDVVAYLKYFTFLSQDAIASIAAEHAQAPHRRIAQRRLAELVTDMVHGNDGLALARRATEVLFGGDLEGLTAAMLEDIFDDVPSAELSAADRVADDRGDGWPLKLFLVGPGRPFNSNGEAKKALKAGAMRCNGKRIAGGVGDLLTDDDLIEGRLAVIRHGRKRNFLVRIA